MVSFKLYFSPLALTGSFSAQLFMALSSSLYLAKILFSHKCPVRSGSVVYNNEFNSVQYNLHEASAFLHLSVIVITYL